MIGWDWMITLIVIALCQCATNWRIVTSQNRVYLTNCVTLSNFLPAWITKQQVPERTNERIK